VQAAIEAGGIDFIAKRFKYDSLAKRIEKVMETFYGKIKGKKEDNQTKIEEVIINEYDRATRAGKSLSFLLYKLLQNNINLTLEKVVSFEPSSEKTLDDLKKELFGEK
jgi:DNA-binding response OmpR family regulator